MAVLLPLRVVKPTALPSGCSGHLCSLFPTHATICYYMGVTTAKNYLFFILFWGGGGGGGEHKVLLLGRNGRAHYVGMCDSLCWVKTSRGEPKSWIDFATMSVTPSLNRPSLLAIAMTVVRHSEK